MNGNDAAADASSLEPRRRASIVVASGAARSADAGTNGALPRASFAPATPIWKPNLSWAATGRSLIGDASLRSWLNKPITVIAPTFKPIDVSAFSPKLSSGIFSWLQDHRVRIDVDALQRDLLPENLRTARIDFAPDRWFEWIEEGLPVAYVLDTATLEHLDAAETPAARRAVIGRRWEHILNAGETLLADLTSSEMTKYLRPAHRTIDGIRAGFPDLAQAYAANTLDTMVRALYTNPERRRWVQNAGAADEPGGLRNALYFAQLQAVHTSFGDGPVPATFNRHGSAHAVGRGRQYSRLNAVLGVGHLISAMWKYELDARWLRR